MPSWPLLPAHCARSSPGRSRRAQLVEWPSGLPSRRAPANLPDGARLARGTAAHRLQRVALHNGVRIGGCWRPDIGQARLMTVIRPSRAQRDGLFGALLVVFILAFARGFPGATTSGGRVAVAIFTAGMAALLLWG